MSQIKITQTGSSIGTKPKQRGTLRALGLRRVGQSRVHTDSPDLRGQIQKVPHLVTVEFLDGAGSGEES